MLNDITPLILTYNEEPNIARTLAKLSWAREIVIVDSASTDHTCEIAARQAGVRIVQHAYTSHAEKWAFGLEQTGITSDWVLALDADYMVSDALVEELRRLTPPAGVDGYRASFRYCIEGQPLRGAAYPPVTVLYRRAGARYSQDGHTQRIHVTGRVLPLSATIDHDDRKPLSHWIAQQTRNMRLEADKLRQTPAAALTVVDRVRRMIVVAPPAMFVYCLIVKGGILDGRHGLYYALQRAAAELLLSLFLIDRLVSGPDRSG